MSVVFDLRLWSRFNSLRNLGVLGVSAVVHYSSTITSRDAEVAQSVKSNLLP